MGISEIIIVLIWFGGLIAVVLSIYFIMKYKSISSSKIVDGIAPIKREPWDWQKPGIVVIGIGIGFLIIGVLSINNFFHDSINVGILVVCTGISMVIANALDKKQKTEE